MRLFLYSLFDHSTTPKLDAIAMKYFGANVPSVRELEQKTALAFVNTNPVMDYTAPLPENVIPVAGVHIKESKPLPKVIQFEVKFEQVKVMSQF